MNYRSSQPEGLWRRLVRERHMIATREQAMLIRNEATRQKLGHRLELASPAPTIDINPMLPFE
jgi:hypothetical protein